MVLDPIFNTGSTLRKLLRDPRRFEVRRKVQQRRTGFSGLFARALAVFLLTTAGSTIFVAIIRFALNNQEIDAENISGWFAIWMGAIFGAIFVAANLRVMLLERRAKKGDGKPQLA